MNNKLTLSDVDPILDKYIPKKLSWIDELFITIKYYKDNILHLFYNIKDGIQNIVYYFPVIWNDRCWDFEYFFLELLKYKLVNTRDGLVKENIIANIENVKNEIDTLLNYIDDYKNSDEIFENNNQNLLQDIKNTEDKDIKDKLLRDYCIRAQMHEIILRDKIFYYLKENCGKWWS